MGITIELTSLPELAVLQSWWRELEARAKPSFFNSWTWIGTWLEVLPSSLEVALLKARQGDLIIGLGVVVRGRSHLLKGIPVDCWRLHATGLSELDDLTIEYNGFLLDERHAGVAAPDMIRYLIEHSSAPHIEIPHTHESHEAYIDDLGPAYLTRRQLHYSRAVELAAVRDAKGQFLPLLSANTRSQIRRSQKEYSKFGELTIHQAESLTEARSYLAALKVLHEHSWQERGQASGFSSHEVAQVFHDKLLAAAFPRGEVQLLRIAAGPRVLGYLYNFCHDGRVAFYQSGFQYHLLDKHDRPGIISHVMAIEYNAARGEQRYDFMAGNHRYKASLATHTEPQTSYVIQRNTMLPRLDASLRHLQGHTRQHTGSIKLASMSIALGLLPALEDIVLSL
jgi:CelD/BcsL family acetyltransferase involved in cellulose biosynthesis